MAVKNVSVRWFVLVVVAVSVAWAAVGDDGVKPVRNKQKELAPVTSEIESAAMQFVQTNHPELVELLQQLKTTNLKQYEQAMRDIARAASMLAVTKRNDPKKYELDLAIWQVNSQIQVLAARFAMSPSPELKEELRAKLYEQIDLRLSQQRLDRERTEARLRKLNESIARLEESRDQEASKAVDRLTRRTKMGSKSAKTADAKGKPAKKVVD